MTTPPRSADSSPPPRARRGGARGRVLFVLTGTLVVLAALAAVTLMPHPVRPDGRQLAAHDWIVLSDPADGTGDRALDRALTLALATGLQQSERINLLPRDRVRAVVEQMRRPGADSAFDEVTAREVAIRAGAAALIVPAVTRTDTGFVVSARMVDPRTGETLRRHAVPAPSRGDLLAALDMLARKLRRDAGDSRFAAARAAPLPDVTTASLDALVEYAAAVAAMDSGNVNGAADHARRAVGLDSSFARAQSLLGAIAYGDHDRPAGDARFARAFAERDRLPERERRLIQIQAAGAQADRVRAIALLREYLDRYPTDHAAEFGLAYQLFRAGEYPEAVGRFRRIVARDSLDTSALIDLALSLGHVGDRPGAVAMYARAMRIMPTRLRTPLANEEFGLTLVRAGMTDSAEAVYALLYREGDASARARGLRNLGYTRALRGQYDSAAALFAASADAYAAFGDQPLGEVRSRLQAATSLFELGRRDAGRRELAAVVAVARHAYLPPVMLMHIGRAAARDGDLAQAAWLLDSARARAKATNGEDAGAVALLTGEVALARRRLTADGLAAMRDGSGKLGYKSGVEMLARAAAASGALDEASTLYQRLGVEPDCCKEWQNDELMARYWLGRLREGRRDAAGAAAAYTAFLDQWTAPSALLAVADARRRLAALRGAPPQEN